MKYRNFMNKWLANMIPPKTGSWSKFLFCTSFSNSHTSINILQIPTNEGSKFKSDSVEFLDSNIYY